VPRLLYEGNGLNRDCLFPHQFLPFFTPSSNHACWVRINHVILLLLGYINLCHLLLGDQSSWKEGDPMGLLVDTSAASEKEQQLICAYQFFQVPMQGTAPIHDLRGYTLDDAQSALLEP
jgi:hypothetical protein